MIHITILLALLIILAALHLLAKHKDGLTSFIKWSAYGVILVAVLVIVCNLAQGIVSMRGQHENCERMEKCGQGMHGGMGDCMPGKGCEMSGRGMCKGMNQKCCMESRGEMNCCAKHSEKMGCEGDENEGEMEMNCHHGDSTMKREIHKDINIEKK